jgi:hypothetical protein
MKFLFVFIFLLFVFPRTLLSQAENRKNEFGIWLGASNPFPGTDTAGALDTTLGLGLFARFQWDHPSWYTEVGTGISNYLSKTERGLTSVPLYAALNYKLPFDLPVSIFFKAGGGAAYVIARPANTAKINPLGVIGTEASFVAGKKVRIGLRVDYHHIFETISPKAPEQTKYFYTSPYEDARLQNPNHYKIKDGQFFHFSLMVSFIL